MEGDDSKGDILDILHYNAELIEDNAELIKNMQHLELDEFTSIML